MGIKKLNESDKNMLMKQWVSWSEKALDALSKTINKEVKIKKTNIKITSAQKLPKFLNPNNDLTNTVVSTELFGPTPGLMVMCFPQKDHSTSCLLIRIGPVYQFQNSFFQLLILLRNQI